MLRLSGTTSLALVFALALCANPLFAQGQGVLQPDVELTTHGPVFEFDGVGPGLDLGTSSAVDLSGGDFTVHAWVKFNELCSESNRGPACDLSIVDKMIGYDRPNEDGWRLFKQEDNRFWFCLGVAGNGCTPDAPTTVKSHTIPELGVWYGVTAVKKSSEIAIYVNGILEGVTTLKEFVDSNTAALLIGANFDEGAYLNGQIAEVQLYKFALSGPHVRALYQYSRAKLGF